MDFVCYFATLIQLISAVNFANIACNFHEEVFKVFFNVDAIINRKFSQIQNSIIADIASLQKIEPIETTNRQSNKKKIDSLKTDYNTLGDKWVDTINTIKTGAEEIQNRKWFKSFFLFISLYCICDITLISIISIPRTSYSWHVLASVLNLGVLCYSLFIMVKAWGQNETRDRYELSKAVTKWFIIILLVACASGIINEVIVKNLFWIAVPRWIECLFLCLSIFLPFTPCLFCSVYAIYETSRVNKEIEILVNSLQDEQNALHNRKVEIDIAYKHFEDNDDTEDISFK